MVRIMNDTKAYDELQKLIEEQSNNEIVINMALNNKIANFMTGMNRILKERLGKELCKLVDEKGKHVSKDKEGTQLGWWYLHILDQDIAVQYPCIGNYEVTFLDMISEHIYNNVHELNGKGMYETCKACSCNIKIPKFSFMPVCSRHYGFYAACLTNSNS
jgi:hypothetical protein